MSWQPHNKPCLLIQHLLKLQEVVQETKTINDFTGDYYVVDAERFDVMMLEVKQDLIASIRQMTTGWPKYAIKSVEGYFDLLISEVNSTEIYDYTHLDSSYKNPVIRNIE